MYYILDHSHALGLWVTLSPEFQNHMNQNHMEYCGVIQTSNDCVYSMYDVAEILTAIQFYYEETVDSSSNPNLDEVIGLLTKAYQFKACNKESMKDSIATVLEIEEQLDYHSYKIWDFEDGACVYLDLYEIRDRLCGPGQPDKLYDKWLTPEIKEDIKKMHPIQ